MVTRNQETMIDTHKKEKNPNITLKKVIKSQGKTRREEERSKEELQKQPENTEQNGNKYTPINNYFECKQKKCSNQKT